jgi:thioredoxin 1
MVKEIFEMSEIPQNGKVVLKMEARWCRPCKNIAPAFARLSEKFPEIVFMKADAEACEDMSEYFNIESYPTFIFLVNGKVVDNYKGSEETGLTDKLIHIQHLFSEL